MGGKTSRSSQEVTIPPEVLARYNAVNARAETTAERPYQIYSMDPSKFVAPLTQAQQAGISQTMQSAGQAQPYFDAATGQLLGAQGSAQPLMTQAQGLAGQSARSVSPGELQTQQFMSPYIRDVVEAQRGLTQRQQEAQMSGAMGQAIRSGAYGGDRAGIAAANLAKEQQLAQAGILSPLLQQGYTQALQTAQQQQGLGLSAEQANRAAQAQASQLLGGLGAQQFGMGSQTAQQLAGLGTGAQGAALQGAQAQLGAGQVAQQTEQAGLQALYNQFLQEQSYPFQVAQFLANIAMGTGALSGSTTTTRQPGGFFSDSRLKEDIEKVGELHDGQPIFKFRYKGEPREATKIGLMADEVEKDKPEAVGLAGGFRTVNYDDATKDAASMGGGVMPRHAGEPFARGGYADGGSPILPGLGGGDLAALLQAQAQMYSPYSSQGPYMGANSPAYGGGAYVPAATLPVSGLTMPASPPPQQPSALEHMNEMAQLGENIAKGYKAGKEQGWWGKGEETTTTTTPGGVAPSKQLEDDAKAVEEIFKNMDAPRARAMGGGLSAMPFSGGTGQGLSIPQQAGDEQLSLGRASGGGINPYGGQGLSIPTEIEKPEPLKPADIGPGRTPFQDVADVAQTAAAFMSMSDRRAKTDIAPVGKLNNGEEVYRYRLKGDPRMQIGLMADEVEERHPEAVGLAGGIKTLDYETATDDAVKRAAGGLVPHEPGDFMYEHQHLPGLAPVRDLTAKYGPLHGLRIAREQHEGRHGYATDGSVPFIRMTPELRAATESAGEFFRDRLPGTLERAKNVASVNPVVPVIQELSRYPYGTGEYPGVSETPAPGSPEAMRFRLPAPASPAGGAGGPSAPSRPPAGGLGAGRPTTPPAAARDQRYTPPPYTGGLAGIPEPAMISPAAVTPADAGGVTPTSTVPERGKIRGLYEDAVEKAKGMGLNKAENLIPLLTGIATMGTAPTRSLGVALASGVGAGAQSYLPTRQAMADIEQTKAATGQTAAATELMRTQDLAAVNSIYATPNFVVREDPNGKIEFKGRRYSLVPKTENIGYSQGAVEALTGPGLISKNAIEQIDQRKLTYQGLSEQQQTKNSEEFSALQSIGANAAPQLAEIGKFGLRLQEFGDGPIGFGALAPLKLAVINYYNDIIRTIAPENVEQALISESAAESLTFAQMAQKMRQEIARGKSSLTGGDNFQNILFAMEATPGTEMTKEAALQLTADLMVSRMRDMDMMMYANDYGRRVYGVTKMPSLQTGFPTGDAVMAFSQSPEFSMSRYQNDAKALANIFGAKTARGEPSFVALQRGLSDPKQRDEVIAGLAERTGNPLFYRYLIGRF